MMKQFKHVNQALGVATLETVTGKVDLNLEQIDTLNKALEPGAAERKEIKQLNAKANATKNETAQTKAKTERLKAETAAAEQQLAAMVAALDSTHEVVAGQPTLKEKILATRALLAAQPGVTLDANLNPVEETPDYKKQGFTDVDWALINSLPHNQEADINS